MIYTSKSLRGWKHSGKRHISYCFWKPMKYLSKIVFPALRTCSIIQRWATFRIYIRQESKLDSVWANANHYAWEMQPFSIIYLVSMSCLILSISIVYHGLHNIQWPSAVCTPFLGFPSSRVCPTAYQCRLGDELLSALLYIISSFHNSLPWNANNRRALHEV